MAKIKTASNNQIKTWRKLGMSKYRKKEGLFIAEGERCVEQILANQFVNVESLIVEQGQGVHSDSEIPVYEVESSVFADLSDTDTPQGVLAVCSIPEPADTESIARQTGIIVALDAVQDPGNVGTIIRTAAWFGAAGILYGCGTADPFHPKVVRSTAGATGAVPYQKGEITELLNGLEKEGWSTLLMDGGSGSEELRSIETGQKTVLVIGNEGNGISKDCFADHRRQAKIPGHSDVVESLNAAIALGIGIYQITAD